LTLRAGINADPEVFNERLVGELTTMFTRYLVGSS
jgi:hypothetical protein